MNAITSPEKLFVAITDEILYEHPEGIEGQLVPYSSKLDCHHWLNIEINPTDLLPLNHAEDNGYSSVVA